MIKSYILYDENNNVLQFIRCDETEVELYMSLYIEYYEDSFTFDSNYTYKIENEEVIKTERVDSPYMAQVKKQKRQNIVENIEVTYNDVVYQGDEKSQDRMSRAIVGMDDDDTIEWTAKDNSKVVLLRSDLKQILRLSGIEQTKVW